MAKDIQSLKHRLGIPSRRGSAETASNESTLAVENRALRETLAAQQLHIEELRAECDKLRCQGTEVQEMWAVVVNDDLFALYTHDVRGIYVDAVVTRRSVIVKDVP